MSESLREVERRLALMRELGLKLVYADYITDFRQELEALVAKWRERAERTGKATDVPDGVRRQLIQFLNKISELIGKEKP